MPTADASREVPYKCWNAGVKQRKPLASPTFETWMESWTLTILTAEPDKPCQANGIMVAVIASDFGATVLILRRSPGLMEADGRRS